MKKKLFGLLAAALLAGLLSGCLGEAPGKQPTGFTEEELVTAVAQAEPLAGHLVGYALKRDTVESGAPISPQGIDQFLLGLAAYRDAPDHPYRDVVTRDENLLFHFSAEGVRQAAYEVFGEEDWPFEEVIPLSEDGTEYLSGLEFGIGGGYSCKELQADTDGSLVWVDFLLTDNQGFAGEPGWEEHGSYRISFDLLREGDRVFLRYRSLTPVDGASSAA